MTSNTRRVLRFPCLVAIALLALSSQAAHVQRDIEYANVDGESLRLDASVPDGAGLFPVAILIHGGGWGGGDKAREHVPPTDELTGAKFAWFSVNYRLAPKHRWPACIDDVRTAIRWVKQHAAEYRGDPNRVALIGYSAGGHLAAFAAVTADGDTRPQALVLLAGPTDLVADCERRGGVSPALQALFDRDVKLDDEARAVLRDTSPIVHASADAPPCLLIHGTKDASVPYSQSLNFQARMQELGVPCELITIPGGEHRLRDWERLNPEYEHQMIEWLERVLNAPQ